MLTTQSIAAALGEVCIPMPGDTGLVKQLSLPVSEDWGVGVLLPTAMKLPEHQSPSPSGSSSAWRLPKCPSYLHGNL